MAAGKIGETGSIEEVRLFATLLLVTYHVIGLPDSGLSLAYPHPLRFLADLFSNFRMPAFAFIAGYIYCLRPVQLGSISAFLMGKLQRLALPGLIAMLVFALMSTLFERNFSLPVSSLWLLALYPYAHYWFLQAILALFVVIGLIDGVTRHKATIGLFAIAVLLVLIGASAPEIFSLNGALLLAPYFTFGMCAYRYRHWVERHAVSVVAFATALFVISFAISTARYITDPSIPADRNMLQAMTFGMSLCLLMLIGCPRHKDSRKIGAFCFTIYLYHILGTAGMRLALDRLGVTDVAIHVPLGVAAGIMLPVAIHLAAKRSPLTALLILGIKRRPAMSTEASATPHYGILSSRA